VLCERRAYHSQSRREYELTAFHDAVMENGGVPFFILEKQIDDYIAAAQKK
jgi:uncharacterized protein (DUF885 family)